MGIFQNGVKKTNLNFFQKLGRAITGKSRVDDDVLDALEEALLGSDMGVDTTLKLIENIEDRVEKDKYVDMEELTAIIRDEIANLMGPDEDVRPFDFSKKPYVMLIVGVNGVGKTTTIGKLASMLHKQGKKVVIGAADTFRA
ncbi:MAG: signal recognition particle receptor subunit alpha, partial [Bacteroidales bacterium]|nr:signal recognition particle receptor subunit alpha [Bacteroidales bacterium]